MRQDVAMDVPEIVQMLDSALRAIQTKWYSEIYRENNKAEFMKLFMLRTFMKMKLPNLASDIDRNATGLEAVRSWNASKGNIDEHAKQLAIDTVSYF